VGGPWVGVGAHHPPGLLCAYTRGHGRPRWQKMVYCSIVSLAGSTGRAWPCTLLTLPGQCQQGAGRPLPPRAPSWPSAHPRCGSGPRCTCTAHSTRQQPKRGRGTEVRARVNQPRAYQCGVWASPVDRRGWGPQRPGRGDNNNNHAHTRTHARTCAALHSSPGVHEQPRGAGQTRPYP
jgi:hypothetical protein